MNNNKAIAKLSSVTGIVSDLEASALRKGNPIVTITRARMTEIAVIKKDSDRN